MEKETIGAIMGARIMAPMITGDELPKSPKEAIRVESVIMTRKDELVFDFLLIP